MSIKFIPLLMAVLRVVNSQCPMGSFPKVFSGKISPNGVTVVNDIDIS